MAKGGGGIKIGGVRVGCGWLVLLILAALWAFNQYLPGIARPVRDGAAAGVRALAGRLTRRPPPAPSPAPAAASTPAPDPSPSATATPAPTPLPEEQATETPAPAPEAPASPETRDLQVGTGKEAATGRTVRIRYTAEEGLPVEFLFMVGAREVASGLEKGVAGMKVGGRRRLALTDDQTRGPLPGGGVREGGLTCEVELVEVL